MTFNEHEVNRATDGRFSEKLGSAPVVGLPSDEVTLYRYHGDVFTVDGIREELGIEAAEPEETLEEVIVQLRDGGEHHWSLPERFTEKRLDVPDEDGVDLDEETIGWYPNDGDMTMPHARRLEDGSIELTGSYYENLRWSGEFTEQELDDAYPIVEKFYRDYFDAEISGSVESWDSVMLDFSTVYQPDEFSPSVVANTSEERMGFVKFKNETDPGTFGSPYAYDFLRERLDEAVVTKERWNAIRKAGSIDADAVASHPDRIMSPPTDAEAIALAQSLSGDEWSGPHAEQIEMLSERGYAENAADLRRGLEKTREATVMVAKQRRVDALLSWLERKGH